MNILKLFLTILKDERGFWESLFGYLSQKKRGDVPEAPGLEGMEWANTPELQEALSKSILGKLNQPTDYSLSQPEVEAEAQKTILGKLRNLPESEEYKSKVEAAKTQQISRENYFFPTFDELLADFHSPGYAWGK